MLMNSEMSQRIDLVTDLQSGNVQKFFAISRKGKESVIFVFASTFLCEEKRSLRTNIYIPTYIRQHIC